MLRNGSIALLAALLVSGCKGGADMSKGGLELVYEAAASGSDDARASALADSARKVASARLLSLKIPAVVRVDGRKLRVGLPAGDGANRAAEAKKVLGVAGTFELREVQDAQFLKEQGKDLDDETPVRITRESWTDISGAPRGCFMVDAPDEAAGRRQFPKEKLPSGTELMLQQGAGAPGERVILVAVGAPLVANDAVQSARAIKDPVATPSTALKLTVDGAKRLEEITGRIKGKKLAQVLDGVILSAPVVQTAIDGGTIDLPQPDVGDRRERERNAELLAAVFNSGPMPAPLRLEEERQVARSR
jgi:preprotein translocase subunit SecD